ncbi:hypothetical protein EG850_10290 [Gulosibacter macacae]|uniref:Uncharacterized protein n=1 Tax=Gulosibacter macacae TaxID=2488791 RepID=A0A3P3VTV1_9MICO|nr:hypothetical protein [Gulosibacter macacae]RRJ86100.1 hypothetical protein EG850_10290 [Gulosibacter macacae]
MPNALRRLLNWMRIPAPFVVGAWTVAAWLIFLQSASGFLSLFIAVPVSFLQMAILGLMLWLRPSVRISNEYRVDDAVWYLGTFVLWAVGAAVPAPWGGVVQVLAFVVGAIGIARIGRASQAENLANMQARAERIREHRADQAGGRAWGPDAGKVITIDTGVQWQEQPDDVKRGGPVVDAEIVDDVVKQDEGPADEWTARPRNE